MLGNDDADEDGDTDVFPWASEPIARVMPVLLERLNDADDANARVATGLSAVGFLASRGGEVVVTLWNRIDAAGDHSGDASNAGDAEWNADANALLSSLRAVGVVGVVTRRRRKLSEARWLRIVAAAASALQHRLVLRAAAHGAALAPGATAQQP